MQFTAAQLKRILPNNRDIAKLHAAMIKIFPKYQINTKERISMFIGQCAHESGEFNLMVENLNYSASGLLKTFAKYYRANPALAQQHERKPELIANYVYANRMGNGAPASGDGWRFRGQGFIQLTGRENHTLFARFLNISLEEELLYIRTLEGALEASCWFWTSRNLNSYADRIDIEGATKVINGGKNGLRERTIYVRRALSVLDLSPHSELVTKDRSVLKLGDEGPDVMALQEALSKSGFNVTKDGKFGNGTKAAVQQFQQVNGLLPDGIAGPKTRALL